MQISPVPIIRNQEKVIFIYHHCPFVKHLKKDIVKLTNFYVERGLAVVAISSNSVATHPQDGPKFMAEEAKLFSYPFPYLYDEFTGEKDSSQSHSPTSQNASHIKRLVGLGGAYGEDDGYEVIKKAIINLSLGHKEHIIAYGEGNERRLTGKHETTNIDNFSWGVANRGCSISVGRDTEKNGKGYMEDRRPTSNMDPCCDSITGRNFHIMGTYSRLKLLRLRTRSLKV